MPQGADRIGNSDYYVDNSASPPPVYFSSLIIYPTPRTVLITCTPNHTKHAAGAEAPKKDELSFGKLCLQLGRHAAYFGEEELSLTKKEYELLEYLEDSSTA